MEWETAEYPHYPKKKEWYLSVFIIAIGSIAALVVLGDILLILLAILGTTAFLLLAIRKPKMINVALDEEGLTVGSERYSYMTLKYFAVVKSVSVNKLILQSKNLLSTFVVVPLVEDIDPEEVRTFLAEYIAEADLRESFFSVLLERIGF